MNGLHRAILDRNGEELTRLLSQKYKKNEKTKEMQSSMPSQRISQLKGATFCAPEPTLDYAEDWRFDKVQRPFTSRPRSGTNLRRGLYSIRKQDLYKMALVQARFTCLRRACWNSEIIVECDKESKYAC